MDFRRVDTSKSIVWLLQWQWSNMKIMRVALTQHHFAYLV